jgi:hypothetical protein
VVPAALIPLFFRCNVFVQSENSMPGDAYTDLYPG